MQRLSIRILSLILLTFSCRLLTPASYPDPSPAPVIEADSTLKAVTIIPDFTPDHLTSQPLPVPSAPVEGYLLNEERQVHGYTIHIWRNPDDPMGFDSILTLESPEKTTIRIDRFFALHDLTGSDLNADGHPEVIVETYSGGAHCCFGMQVYSLRENAVLILRKPESNAGGYFLDLDLDGVSEYITFDDSFAYQYCPYAAGISVKVILAYDLGMDKYLPASARFPEQYQEEIAAHKERALASPGESGEWDGSNICAILPLVLDFFYLGQPEKAQTEFMSRYSGSDAQAKWQEVVQNVQASSLFAP